MRASHLQNTLAAALFLAGTGSPAQTAATGDGAVQPPALQRQIDELKEGQRKLQLELEEIKALLKDRSGRVEVAAAPQLPGFLTVNVFGEPFRGDAKARVAILEYSDFDCTFCGTYAREIYPRIEARYVRTGRVKYFFRDFPGPEHPNALFKARVARCAGAQGRFWEMHDRLFADQKELHLDDLGALARAAGLDAQAFGECLNGETFTEPIRRSAASAIRYNLRGTPAFLVGTLNEDGSILRATQVFMGAQNYEKFQGILEDLLAQK